MDENFNFISKMYSTKSLYVAKTSGSSGHALAGQKQICSCNGFGFDI